MQAELEIVAPVTASMAVVRQHRVVEEDAQAIEIGAQAVEHNDVGRNEQKVAREVGACLVAAMKEAPRDQQRQHLGLARASGHLDDVARPIFREVARTDLTHRRIAHQVELVARTAHVVQPDHTFNGLALREVIAERLAAAVALLGHVVCIEPPAQQGTRSDRCPGVAAVTPGFDFGPHLRHQRRDQAFV